MLALAKRRCNHLNLPGTCARTKEELSDYIMPTSTGCDKCSAAIHLQKHYMTRHEGEDSRKAPETFFFQLRMTTYRLAVHKCAILQQ